MVRNDLLTIIDPAFARDSLPMVILLLPPLLACAVGLAGNTMMVAGHTTWGLANSLFVGAVNTVVNMWLIPRYGMLGAAIGSAGAAALLSGLQLGELYSIERVLVPLSLVYKPLIALGAMLSVAFLLWDPAALSPLWVRITCSAALTGGYIAMLLLLRHEEAGKLMASALRHLKGAGGR